MTNKHILSLELRQARRRLIKICAYGLFPISVFLLVSVASSGSGIPKKLDTINVYPGAIETDGWANGSSVLEQDLGEDALYQAFNTSNAAYVGEETKQEAPSAVPNSDSGSSGPEGGGSTYTQISSSTASTTETVTNDEGTGNSGTTTTPETTTQETQSDTPGTTETGTPEPTTDNADETPSVSTPDETTDVPITESSSPTESAPEPTGGGQSENSAPVSFLDATKGFFAFVSKIASAFPFASESTTTPLSQEEPQADTQAPEAKTPVLEPITDTTPSEVATTSESIGGTKTSTASTPAVIGTSTEENRVQAPIHASSSNDNETPVTPSSTTTEIASTTPLETSEIAPETEPPQPVATSSVHAIMLSDFSIPELASGQFITNAQLRMSFAARLKDASTTPIPTLDVAYKLNDTWQDAGSITIDGEVSNALNGGYFLFALPTFTDVDSLKNLEVKISYHGNDQVFDGVYLDAAWIEIHTETFDRSLLTDRINSEMLKKLQGPKIHELISTQLDFSRNEDPKFVLRYKSQRNVIVRFLRSIFSKDLAEIRNVSFRHKDVGPIGLDPDITMTPDGLWTIQLTDADRAKLRPGEYTVELTIAEGGKTFTDSFDFQWGMLAINPDQTEYETGDTATISLGALTQNGNTLCNADLRLYIIDPRQFMYRTPVTQSGLCDGNNVVDEPDYNANFTPTIPGEYEMYVERLDRQGEVVAHTSDTFHVVLSHGVALSRNGPTRIFPPSPYPMQITLSARNGFSGTLTEQVPGDFKISDTDAKITRDQDGYKLSWDVDILASSTKTYSYTFDAPDISPYLYELGPAELTGEGVGAIVSVATSTASSSDASSTPSGIATQGKTGTDFVEHRKWQIASDATGNMILYWDDGSSIPTDWQCISCAATSTFFQRFARGDSTYNTTGGSTTHTHTATGAVLASTDATTESGSGSISPVSHQHTYTPTIESATNLPTYRQLRVIEYTASAGTPPSIPEGAIGIFDVASSSLPTGWVRYAAQDGYYIYGENTVGTIGGTTTPVHRVHGTTGAADGSGQRVRGGVPAFGATAGHTHTVEASTTPEDVEPPYLEVVLGKVVATGSTTVPVDLITMWSGDVPTGWVDVSSDGSSDFNGRFLKASTTYGATGGSETHTHADISTTSSVPNSTTQGRPGSAGASDTHVHVVNVTDFSTATNVPPYATVIFGKNQGSNPVYKQLSYRWYVNGTSSSTPTDPWPAGATDLSEKEAITATSTTVANGDLIRLRISMFNSNATSSAGTDFKLQYAAGNSCSSISTWNDVGSATSSEIWRGYDNSGVTDHSTLLSNVLSSTTVSETYEENGFATSTPNDLGVSDVGEWDFVLEQNGAASSTNYCFRMVENDGTPFNNYASYPQLLTNRAPDAPTLSAPFDNEKTPTTTSLSFKFVTSDPESEDLNYQIEVDDNYDFGSPVINKNTVSNGSQFDDLTVGSEKDPYPSGDSMRFRGQTALTNGTTYYWRVRARDPDGSNKWGDWSLIRSFTIDTSLTLSTWFQTEDEQFETNTLTSATTTGSDNVSVIATTTTVSVLDAFSTGNTKTISSGNNRLLVVGIASEDSATNVNVNTVTYGGQQLTQIDDVQVGSGFSNGMWVGYLDEEGIENAVGTTITPTWVGGTPDTAVLYSSVVYENVDQTDPVPDASSNTGTTISTIQPSSALSVLSGDAVTYFTVSGDTGQTHTPASGYTEGTEQDSGGSGSVAANAYKLITTNGSEQPTADWTNSQSRLAIVALRVKQSVASMVSTAIDFDDGDSGNAWGDFSWNDTETSGSILYQVQYYNGSSWALVPDSDLSGNAAGFGTSPVSLLNLDTDTYNIIRLVADFVGTNLTVNDWTLSWGTRVGTPSITKLFPNEKVGTTTPTFEFSSIDPQSDPLTYQVQWSTSYDFSASTTRTSSSSAGFINAEDSGDSDPFTSGNTIQFTIQPADALTDNTTYWWRVRAADSTSSNAFSFWTEPRSFTVSSTTQVSTWYQTTKEQFDTDTLSGTQSLSNDSVSVASTASEAMVVYGEGTESAPRYRLWNGTSLSSEGTMQDVSAPIKWAKVKAGTTREEYTAVTVGTDGDINAQVYSLGSWGNLQELTTTSGSLDARGFDVAYESLSGDAMVVYCDGDSNPSYATWDGSNWTNTGTVTVSESTNCEWIQLASDPTSDEIIMVERGSDGNPYEAQVWNATTSTWGNATTFGSVLPTTNEGMAVQYEESGNQAIVVTGNGNPNSFRWNSWNGTAWSGDTTLGIGGNFEWGELVRDKGSDNMALCLVDDTSDIAVARWSGSGWTLDDNLETSANSSDEPPMSCSFEDTAGRDGYIMLAYSNTTSENYQYYNGIAWSGGAALNSINNAVTNELEKTDSGTILGMFFDDTNDRLLFSTWDGNSWSTTTTVENDASVDTSPFGKPYSIAPRNPSSQGTVVVSPQINFSDGVGPYWQQMYWDDSTPGTSNILYSVQYYDSASSSWKFIPDSDLPGNSSGTTTGPIDLSALDKNTYSIIRPYASLSCDGSGSCPEIRDWTVEWAAGITVSGTIQQFDQATNVNSGTVNVAVNGTLQVGKTGTISGGSWSISNVTVDPGDVVTVFVQNPATAAEKAVGVTRYDGTGNITGMQLYQNHLTLGSDDSTSTPLTNADIGGYDVNNDTDVFFDLTGSSLTLCATAGCGNAELYINASTTYEPSGTLDTNDIEINGSFLPNGNTIYVSGSWDNNATATMATSTVDFTATSSTETVDSTGAAVSSFNNVTFGTSTGAATWTLATPLDVNGSLTVSRGTFDRGTEAITVAKNLTNGTNGTWSGIGTTTFDGATAGTWSDQNSTLQNIGDVVIDGTSKTVTLGADVAAQSITIGADDILDASASNHDITVYKNWTNNNTFVPHSGQVTFAATTTNRVITSGGNAFYDLTFDGAGGSWSFSEANLTVNNDLTIATGTVTMPTGTTTLAGSFSSAGGTFAHNNGTLYLTSSGAETITASGTAFSNTFYNLSFEGSGSWTMLDGNATTSNDFRIFQGTVTLPSGILTVGGNFSNSAGSFVHNSGIVRFTSASTKSIDTNASFNSLLFDNSGSWSFIDSNVTAVGDLTVANGTVTLPSGTLNLGGSLTNSGTLTHNNGTVLFDSADSGETIDLGGSPLYNMIFNSATGGWTILTDATTTHNFSLATSSDFTLTSGRTLNVEGTFTNNVGGASTTWTGTTLSLLAGTYSINTKNNAGDSYDTLKIAADTHISMWNSVASTYITDNSGSLYSEDHNAVDGDLYIFGAYARTSGSEYWDYATDFDGTDLSGGSERQVNIRFASSASAAFNSTTFEAVGTSTASTTVANQGSGTYTISVTGGTTTMQYYDLADLGGSGLSLLGSTTVSKLSDGNFTVSGAGGTALTVSSTTIDANPAKQIFRVGFSTTTAISATNVTQTDSTPSSYWWFRSSHGNIDGEAFDNDTGDPGSIRWDDSALTITLSGTIYDTDEATDIGGSATCSGGTPVRVVVNGATTYDGACDGSGHYSIPGVVILGDPVLTVFLNGAAGGEKAVTVTRTPTGDISDLDLYVNRVTTRHEDTEPLTIANMAVYDNSDDSDIMFTAATGTNDTLTVFPDNELHIASSTTFTPGGTVTLESGGTGNSYDGSLHIDDNATFTGEGTTTYSIGGTFAQDAGATFIPASSTVVMTATTTGKAITTENGETIDFDALTFTGTGGGWNINGNISVDGGINVATGTVTGTGDITLTNGSFYGNGLVSLGGGTTTIDKTNTLGGTQDWTFHDLTLGSGSVVGTTTPANTGTTTVSGRLTIGTGHFLLAGGSKWDLSGQGTVFVENGTFLEGTSTVRYSNNTSANVLSTTYYNLDLNGSAGTPTYTVTGLGVIVSNDLTVGGEASTIATFDANDPSLDVNGDVIVRSNGTLIGSNSAQFTVAGNWDNNGTYTASGGTVTFDGSGSASIAAGNSSFSTAVIDGSGDFTVSEDATATSAFTLASANTFTLGNSQALSVGGTFTNGIGGGATTWSSSTLYLYGGGNYAINASTTNDDYGTLRVGANTQIRMWNSSASTIDVASTGSLYSMDHNDVNGYLFIYGDYVKTSGTDYWDYATDFDGASLSGSERAVTVFIEADASLTYTGGGLSVIGVSSATTSIRNQGSGSYSFRIGGSASTSWSYYQVRNTDIDGLVFSGTPNVVTLSHGDFLVETASGTAITVGGTVIDQNPAKTFTKDVFATSSAIIARNVTATGTSVSSWRFTNHSGNIAGEAFDVDPGGDPGYVVWDDSAANITISGHVYSDEGSTVSTVCDSSTNDIELVVAGLTTYQTSCNGDGLGGGTGLYSISGISYSPGDSLVVYISGETQKAATVTVDPVSSIGNMDLYENRVIVRHESTNPITIADMAVWDSSDDADIPFTAVDSSPDTLTLPSDTKLIVWTGKTFKPGGNMTLSGGGAGAAYDGTLELYQNAVFVAQGTESHSIGGSLISDSGASFTAANSSVTFTTTGAARTVDTNENAFYDLIFNGSGSWSVTNSALNVGNDLTLTQGSVTLPNGTTTVSGSFSNTGGSFDQNGGHMFFDSNSSETIRTGGSDFGTTTFDGSGSWTYLDHDATSTGDFTIANGTVTSASGTLTVGGSFVNDDTFTHNSGVLRFTSGSSSVPVTAGGSDLYGVTFDGSGGFIFTDTNVSLADTLSIVQGSVTFASGTMSIGGSLLNTGGSFDNASGTILFNSSDTGETIDTGGSDLATTTFAGASGGWTIISDATSTSNFSLTSASNFTLASGKTLTIGGVFTNLVGGSATTWTGSTLRINSGTGYSINSKTAGGDQYDTLSLGPNTDLSMWNSAATTTTVDTTSSLYSEDHGGVDGHLYIYGDYHRTTATDYWDYATDFDGTDLTGGSERVVNVYLANGATTTLSGGTLEIIGASLATTTIENQGSGVYGMNITGGTLDAQNYAFRNLAAKGLQLSGTTAITSISNGDFELAVDGGSLITLSSTTLNYNASAVITGMRFATTTAISGTNVELVGSTPSAWTFTSHRGNLAGEAFDIDGATDCGSLRWDDSSCLITEESGYRWRNDDGGEGVPNSEWFDTNWSKRKRVTITNSDATTYTDAAIKLSVNYDSDMQSDFDDLRFTDSSGTTTLSYFIEKYTASTDATVWVKVPSLAASGDTTVYMYYGNGGVSDSSNGTSTFSVFEDFEDNDLSEYSGDTSQFTTSASGAYERTHRLVATDPDTGRTNAGGMYDSARTVSQGETLRYFQYIDTSAGSGDESCTLFATQSQTENYAVCLELFGTDRISISKDVLDNDQSGTVLASSTVSYSTGWYEIEVKWGTDNSINVSLYQSGSLVATTSATNSSYTSGGIGYSLWFYHGGWDAYSSRPLLTNEPSASFGGEQVNGGASWLSALNTKATSVEIGDIVRPRFLIENSGLPVTDQYQLEFAPKGSAPSCESVSAASYNAVPPQGSCGSSDLCMESSTHYSNHASTTDLLGGTGTFTSGQIIEDPSNETNSITVGSSEYTELEYAITPTVNVTDSDYCLRVTDAGTDLDSYTRVAELELLFPPNITSLSLNGGQDITLLQGATTTVYATGTVSDLNGYSDLAHATATIFRSGVGESCTADDNNCYISGPSLCSFTNCSGNSCDVECTADIYYFAEPTDVGSTYAGETWRALLSVDDQGGSIATATAPSVDLMTLRAISVNNTINYGSVAVNSNTGSYNASTTINNIGNESLDLSLDATDLSDGGSSIIPAYDQIFATSTFTYSSCVYCTKLSATSTVDYKLDLAKPTTTATSSDDVYWGISIPFGVAGTAHSGTNYFTPISDLP